MSIYRYLLDTNILVYAHDIREKERQIKAIQLLRHLHKLGNTALPAQSLAEFSNVALKKFKPSWNWKTIELQIIDLSACFPILPLSTEIIIEALREIGKHQFSYYDAQIWAVAKIHQIPIILSEDFNPNSTIEDVTFINPFSEDFYLL